MNHRSLPRSPFPKSAPLLLFLLLLFIHSSCYGPVEEVPNKTSRFGWLMAGINGKQIDGSEGFDDFPLSVNGQFRLLIQQLSRGPSPIIQPLNAIFERFFPLEGSIDKAQWDLALPTKLERQQMRELILFLFQLDDFGPISSNASFLARFVPQLAKSIELTFIQNRFCIIHERLPASPSGLFPRFWGYLVLSSPANSPRPNIHHSAAHFQSDGDVCNESAAIFERTGSRSLVISGASRFAVRGKFQSACQPKNALADAAHNNETMFHRMCTALVEAAKRERGGGAQEEAIFLQWHGMAESSCAGSRAFLSVGAKGSHPIYERNNATVNRLVTAVNLLAGPGTACTPASDKSCRLVASTNILGRIINGVPARECCQAMAKSNSVKGQFVHIEQKREMRGNWDLWTEAIKQAIPAKTE